ncbi:Fur family transcriptional regulator [Salinisphaera sp. Q1T1-3]|uniref:Fur family transcriptional regulator n=1 Tax=Salinisphaera sp. Q1T1-3 TaxID=2321229 RepID=UPI000E744427|nr:Fur family transcriptional regulator [Salinisphaera sp. Q1T1-3]RJS93368.1 transcriptional repressor [Salinisphaera sp. Q1T1-3]
MPHPTSNVALSHTRHDHQACIADALTRADALCRERGLRLTEIRRRVLELIWANHQPTKAYDLLAQINAERGNAAPPTIYRALDFLLEAGLIHKIESQNAFIGCAVDHDRGQPKFFICRVCGGAAEIQSNEIDRAIDREARRAGFVIDHQTLEVDGLCALCADQSEAG